VSIAGLSSIKGQSALLQQVGIRVLKMAMDNANAQAEKLLQTLEESNKAMELSAQPHLGSNIDLKI